MHKLKKIPTKHVDKTTRIEIDISLCLKVYTEVKSFGPDLMGPLGLI